MNRQENAAGSACTFVLLAGGLEMEDSSHGGDLAESGGGSDPGTSDTGKADKGLGGR